jgi:hypothetical protein
MGRGPKPPKGKAKPAVARKLPKDEGARVRDLEKRLRHPRSRAMLFKSQLGQGSTFTFTIPVRARA